MRERMNNGDCTGVIDYDDITEIPDDVSNKTPALSIVQVTVSGANPPKAVDDTAIFTLFPASSLPPQEETIVQDITRLAEAEADVRIPFSGHRNQSTR